VNYLSERCTRVLSVHITHFNVTLRTRIIQTGRKNEMPQILSDFRDILLFVSCFS
jgi:hypothetical protein